MKARKLKEILGETGYIIADFGDYIGIGNGYIHDIIHLDKRTKKIENKTWSDNEVLSNIYSKLNDLIDTPEFEYIIFGNDDIGGMFPVYFAEKGNIVEEFTDEFGYPNVTHTGRLMYENTHFRTVDQAIDQGISETEVAIQVCEQNIRDKQKELDDFKDRIIIQEKYNERYKQMKLVSNDVNYRIEAKEK